MTSLIHVQTVPSFRLFKIQKIFWQCRFKLFNQNEVHSWWLRSYEGRPSLKEGRWQGNNKLDRPSSTCWQFSSFATSYVRQSPNPLYYFTNLQGATLNKCTIAWRLLVKWVNTQILRLWLLQCPWNMHNSNLEWVNTQIPVLKSCSMILGSLHLNWFFSLSLRMPGLGLPK